MNNAIKNEKLYNIVFNYAYTAAVKYTKDDDIAKDIAQSVLIEYHFFEDPIINLNNWVYTVSKNKSLNHVKKMKIESKMISTSIIELSNSNNLLKEKVEMNEIEFVELLKSVPTYIVSIKDKELLEKYFMYKCDINKLSFRRNKESLRKKIFRIKSEIKAWNNANNGVVGTKRIVGAKLNENILNFVKSFKENINNNTIFNMKKYFSDCNIPNFIPEIHIKSIIKYNINLFSSRSYRLWVHYFDHHDQFRSFVTNFRVTESNKIRIIDFPKPPDEIKVIEKINVPKSILSKLKKDSKGRNIYTEDELEKLLESKGSKLETIFEK